MSKKYLASLEAARNQFAEVNKELATLRKRKRLLEGQEMLAHSRGRVLPTWAAEELARVNDRIKLLADPEDGIRVHNYRPTHVRANKRGRGDSTGSVIRAARSGRNTGRWGRK